MRFDDTNPVKEDTEYVDSIMEDVRWLGFEWASVHYASDYFDQLYEWAVQLIKFLSPIFPYMLKTRTSRKYFQKRFIEIRGYGCNSNHNKGFEAKPIRCSCVFLLQRRTG